MKRVAFVDLDKTLIFSKRSIPSGMSDVITCFQRKDDPNRGCWMPKSYMELLSDLNCEIVVVTARDKADIDKLNLPFEAKQVVCNFGALIYENGETIHSNLSSEDLKAMEEFGSDPRIGKIAHPTRSHKHLEKDVVWHYVYVSEHFAKNAEEEVAAFIAEHYPELTTQRNGRHFDVFPSSCLKENAVKDLIEGKYKNYFKLGFGDSVVDHGFMSLCDLAITPSKSQLFNQIGAI